MQPDAANTDQAALGASGRRDRPSQPGLPLGDTVPVPLDDLVRINTDAARFFQARLAGSWVPGYLASRGFGLETLARWQVGYAPAGWSGLVSYLRGIGYRDELIEAAGLARRSAHGTLIDIFRDRAMLPIRLADGTVAAFIGRAAKSAGAGVPKYMNSPGTGLYEKGAMLFGLWEAREALARGARPVVVEGPLDAMAVSANGGDRYAGVAPCGTALTARQVTALDQVADLGRAGVLVAFDDDQAGRRAAVRAYHLLAPVTRELRAVALPQGQDPAQVLECQGPAALAATLAEHTRPLADLVVDAELDEWSRWLQYAEGQINALRATAPLIAAMPPADVARQVARVADRLGLDYATVTSAVTDALPEVITEAPARQDLRGPPGDAPHLARQGFPSGARKGLLEGTTAGSERSRATRKFQAHLPGRRVPG